MFRMERMAVLMVASMAVSCAGGTDPGGDGCPSPYTACDGVCLNTALDPANCGDCGFACDAGEVCSEGMCQLECGGTTTECLGLCVDTTLDPNNCGDCGVICTLDQVCSEGTCQLECVGGTTECDGLCVDTLIDPANCGGCADVPATGDHVCDTGEVCSAGTCLFECAGGTTECDGVCVDTLLDPDNCGGCGDVPALGDHVCALGEVCFSGTCVLECVGGTTECDGVCVDTLLDSENCGGCADVPEVGDHVCESDEVCTDGTCQLECIPPTEDCLGVCTNTEFDPDNCGTCGHGCGTDEACLDRTCVPVVVTYTGTSCASLLASGATTDGVYMIDPDGTGPATEFGVYCDMTTLGGGWTRCLEWLNTATEDHNDNTWFDQCVDWSMASWTGDQLMVKLEDSAGSTVYAESGVRAGTWTTAHLTSSTAVGDQFDIAFHTMITLTNGDNLMLAGNTSNNGGCHGDMGNGYGLLVFGASAVQSQPRIMVMPYRKQVGSTLKRGFGVSNAEWYEDNEITYDGTIGVWNTCGYPPGYLGTFEFYVQ